MSNMKKGSVIVNRDITTQVGRLTAETGTQLVSVFLGSVESGEDPEPERRLEDLGWRQMSMFEVTLILAISDKEADQIEVHHSYSCLGAVDAVEAAVRFAKRMLVEDFELAQPGEKPAYLHTVVVRTMQVGPIAEDGSPFAGHGSAFFAWRYDRDITLDDHLDALRARAKEHAS